jgi:hypothetical protein
MLKPIIVDPAPRMSPSEPSLRYISLSPDRKPNPCIPGSVCRRVLTCFDQSSRVGVMDPSPRRKAVAVESSCKVGGAYHIDRYRSSMGNETTHSSRPAGSAAISRIRPGRLAAERHFMSNLRSKIKAVGVQSKYRLVVSAGSGTVHIVGRSERHESAPRIGRRVRRARRPLAATVHE